MLGRICEGMYFFVKLCGRKGRAGKMTCVKHASHTHEEMHANVVVVSKLEGTHAASQATHHNLHVHCHACVMGTHCMVGESVYVSESL